MHCLPSLSENNFNYYISFLSSPKLEYSFFFVFLSYRCTLECTLLNLLPFSCAPWVCAFCLAASLFGKDHTVPLIKIFILASAASTQKFPVATMTSPIVKCVCVCGFFSVTGILCHPIVNGNMLDHDGSTKWVCSGIRWH